MHSGQEILIACVLALREVQEKTSESPQRWEEVSENDEHAPFSMLFNGLQIHDFSQFTTFEWSFRNG